MVFFMPIFGRTMKRIRSPPKSFGFLSNTFQKITEENMNKKYYIFVGNEKIEVDQKIYQNYWQITNREKYLERLDRKSKLLFFSDLSSEYPCEESLEDETINVEKIVETKMMLEAVREAISELNDEEKEIIFRLFYEEESLRSIAKDKEISAPALLKRRNKIFEKLKKLLKDII